jgi:hypothetical protein
LLGFVLVGGIGSPVAASNVVVTATAGTTLVSDTFTGTTADNPNWVLPAASGTTEPNDACITAGSNTTQTPIPGCGASAGTVGGLQLTPVAQNQEGGVGYGSSVPSALGLNAKFDSQQLGGTHADGITFYLAASDPTNANASPVTLGPPGGYLGYSGNPGGSVPGLTNAYLGIGLDVFGNFSNSGFDGSGCPSNPTSGAVPNSLTVRGPGNGTTGYCRLGTQQQTLYDGNHSTPVDVAVNPTANDITVTGEESTPLTVQAGTWEVQYFPDGSATPNTLSGELPDASSFLPASWVGDGGIPKQLSFGWSASTGDSTDQHVVWNTSVSTLTGTPPTLGVELTDNSGGTAHSGQTVTYSAATTISAADADQQITMTDTFPNTLTPQGPNGGSGTGWTCGISGGGQTVTCTHDAAAQGSLPTVSMPVTVNVPSGPPQSVADSVTVGSPDATQGTDTDTETYSPAPSATTLKFIGQPVTTGVGATMMNPDSSITHVRVEADLSGGAKDTTFTGPVTLGFSPGDQNSPQFLVPPGNTTASSITVNAVNGVADFSPIKISAQGIGDTLTATSSGLTGATSSAFDVDGATTTCQSNNTCPPVNVNSPATGQTALIQGQKGAGNTIITASFGGVGAPIHPCTGATAGILTFTGNRQKIITLTFPAKVPTLIICYGQPTPFKDITFRNTTFFNQTNKDYEGALGPCLLEPAPCVRTLTWKKGTETVVIVSSAADPHAMH